MLEIKNKLNLWEYKDYYRWYRIDKKLSTFFRKVKWMLQRAKYGYCDMDLWNLDYTLGNYIAASVNELANRTHGYPFQCSTPEEWDGILRSIARSFYMATNRDECWENKYDNYLDYSDLYYNLDETHRAYWDAWFEEEKDIERTMNIRRQEGFTLLQKWFTHLWD